MLKPRNLPGNLPDIDRLSVLAATILLAYALTNFIDLPARDFAVQLPGLFLNFQINFRVVIAIIAAGLTASGADWLMRDHPGLGEKSTYVHWILPALTAWVIGIMLFNLPLGLAWWILFFGGGTVLMLVLLAEYIVIDPDDLRYTPASASLTAVSFALFLILGIVIQSIGLRLFTALPALATAVFLVSARAFHLRLHGRWKLLESLVVTIITVQIAAALHYWPLSPISFGLAILGPAYALTGLISRLEEGESLRQALIEPVIVLILSWFGAALA